ncbi:MAG: DegT/DnrJ/EryC1/StrS family aminotransferase [Actinomycetia bacterium]|nr:DegT/DnrJ/EryC1/StrS family aminotransferase [Actinomycetes bacterium]
MPGPGSFLIGEEEKKEVLDVLESGYFFRYGSEDDPDFKHKVVTFEEKFAKYIRVGHCVALSSGTSALLTCLSALGIGPGDEVIVSGYTFIASISSIIYARAIPVLAEIDESLTMDPCDIEKKITVKTKAIMPVHMLGNPCDMDAVMKIAKKHNLYVIEDACQAAGASYKGKKLGSIGDIGAFSLNFFKTISAGDGGMVATDDDMLYERAFGFHDQGHKPSRMGVEVGDRSIIGLNFRVNELTGAVALAQLGKIEKIISTLHEKKKKLKDAISSIEGIKFRKINDEGECGTLLTLLFDDKDRADRFCKRAGTKTIYHSGWHVYNNMENILGKKMLTKINCPFECPYYGKKIKYSPHMLPKTDDILQRAVNISVGVVDAGLGAGFGISILSSDKEIDDCADKIKNIMADIS